MFGSLGLPELVMIFIVALLLFGPRKLPEIGRTVGRALNEFRRASNDLKRTLEDEVAAEDLRAAHRDLQQAVADPYAAGVAAAPPSQASPLEAGTPPPPEASDGPAAGAPGQPAEEPRHDPETR